MPDKSHIIFEATKMIISQGVRAVRMDDIATDLGVSKRTLYEMFEDKESLITECLMYYFSQVEQKYKNLMDQAQNIIERTIVILQDLDQTIETNIKLMDGVRKFYPKIHEEIILLRGKSRNVEELRRHIQCGIDEGIFLPHINAELATAVFSNSLYGLVLNMEGFEKRNIVPAQAFKYIITYFFRGISTEKGIRMMDEYIHKKENK